MRPIFLLISALAIGNVHATEAHLALGEHDAIIHGTRIHYQVAGSGPLLVVQAPGWGIGSSYLRKGLHPLEATHTVLTYDPRNSGASVRVAHPEKLNTSDMADDLEQLRIYWGADSLDLLGHSHGGAIALAYAERYPTRVKHLILVGGQLIGFSSSDEGKAIADMQKHDPAFSAAYGPSVAEDNDDALESEFRRTFIIYLHNPKRDAAAVARTLPDAMVASSQGAERILPDTPHIDEVGGLPLVEAKTLLLVGRFDLACPPGVSKRMHDGIPSSTLQVLEDSGHFPWMEEPTPFFASVTRFLAAE